MGAPFSLLKYKSSIPEHTPLPFEKPTFDPQFGFETPRKERESKISLQEMKALKIRQNSRDYCVHKLKDYLFCMRKNAPFSVLCRHEYEEYEHCQYEDLVLRMKEYEREKRLRIRELKKQERTIS